MVKWLSEVVYSVFSTYFATLRKYLLMLRATNISIISELYYRMRNKIYFFFQLSAKFATFYYIFIWKIGRRMYTKYNSKMNARV